MPSESPDEESLDDVSFRRIEEIDLAIHAHPTMSEAIGEAALDSLGRVLHI